MLGMAKLYRAGLALSRYGNQVGQTSIMKPDPIPDSFLWQPDIICLTTAIGTDFHHNYWYIPNTFTDITFGDTRNAVLYSHARIADHIRGIRGHLVFIYDACHSGAITEFFSSFDPMHYSILTSCGESQSSYASNIYTDGTETGSFWYFLPSDDLSSSEAESFLNDNIKGRLQLNVICFNFLKFLFWRKPLIYKGFAALFNLDN